MVAGTLVVVTGISVLIGWPAAATFISQRKSVFVFGGWLVCIAGITAGLGLPIFWVFQAHSSSPYTENAVIYGGTMVALLGVMTASLPRMTKQVRDSRADLAMLKQSDAPRPDFRGIREGIEATLTVARDWLMFLQITGPWVVLIAAGFLILTFFGKGLRHFASGLPLLGVALVFLAGLVVSWPTVMVAWHRWIISGERPSLFVALPDRATLSYSWPLWLFASLMWTADKLASSKITQIADAMHLSSASAVGDLASWTVDILVIALGSSAALRLPAIAVRDARFSRTVAMVEGRRMWPGLPLGLAISIAPFYVFNWVLGELFSGVLKPNVPAGDLRLIAAGVLIFGIVVTFAGIASAVTFLSRAYLAAKARVF